MAVWTYFSVTVTDSVLMYLITIRDFLASVNVIFPMFFRVKNLDAKCVRYRFFKILFVLKEVLHDYYINQQGRIIIF